MLLLLLLLLLLLSGYLIVITITDVIILSDLIAELMTLLVLLQHINTMFGKMIAEALEPRQDSLKENVRQLLITRQ